MSVFSLNELTQMKILKNGLAYKQIKKMDPNLAKEMFEEFATLVLLGMPPGTEFGIDINSWNVGDKFKGVKMIPPGLHFVYFSAVNQQGDTAPRTGFFHIFKQREVVVRHYDALAEDLKDEDENPEEVERIRTNLHDLDRFLGAYPAESWQKWVSLTHYIVDQDLERILPLSGRICSAPELILRQPSASPSESLKKDRASHLDSASESDKSRSKDLGEHESHINKEQVVKINEMPNFLEENSQDKPVIPGLPDMVPRPGTELRFSKFPNRPYRDGATPSEITHYSIDSSYSVQKVVENLEKPECLLAELQFSFVCFLVGQVWDGWEQWRLILSTLCRAEELLLKNSQMFLKLLSVIHFQIQEVPEDLFVDIVESNNFLAAALTNLFANISDNSATLPSALVSKAMRFKQHLVSKFSWNLTLEDEGEDAPVVVETEEMADGLT